MIGGDHGEWLAARGDGLDGIEQAADLLVCVTDLGIVPIHDALGLGVEAFTGELRAKRFAGAEWLVGVEVVHPQKEGCVSFWQPKPCERRFRGGVSTAIERAVHFLAVPLVIAAQVPLGRREIVVVEIEPLLDSESPVENEGTHERGSVIARELEDLGTGLNLGDVSQISRGQIADRIIGLCGEPQRLGQMRKIGMELVDGNGARRIVDGILDYLTQQSTAGS